MFVALGFFGMGFSRLVVLCIFCKVSAFFMVCVFRLMIVGLVRFRILCRVVR